ncbi:hypothetical protein D3C86_1715540 [compost metagenome]
MDLIARALDLSVMYMKWNSQFVKAMLFKIGMTKVENGRSGSTEKHVGQSGAMNKKSLLCKIQCIDLFFQRQVFQVQEWNVCFIQDLFHFLMVQNFSISCFRAVDE